MHRAMKTLEKVPRSHDVLFIHGQQGALPTHGLQSHGKSSPYHNGVVLDRGWVGEGYKKPVLGTQGSVQDTDH